MIDSGRKILIADDDEANLEFYEQVLRPENYGIVKARDGVEALDRFAQYQPDLVLLDVAMPRLNGFQVCSQLKRQSRGQMTPVMLLTGLEEREARHQAFLMGADDFLIKPVDRIELLARVRSLFRMRRSFLCLDQQQTLLEGARAELLALRQCLERASNSCPEAMAPPVAPILAEALAACKRLDDLINAP